MFNPPNNGLKDHDGSASTAAFNQIERVKELALHISAFLERHETTFRCLPGKIASLSKKELKQFAEHDSLTLGMCDVLMEFFLALNHFIYKHYHLKANTRGHTPGCRDLRFQTIEYDAICEMLDPLPLSKKAMFQNDEDFIQAKRQLDSYTDLINNASASQSKTKSFGGKAKSSCQGQPLSALPLSDEPFIPSSNCADRRPFEGEGTGSVELPQVSALSLSEEAFVDDYEEFKGEGAGSVELSQVSALPLWDKPFIPFSNWADRRPFEGIEVSEGNRLESYKHSDDLVDCMAYTHHSPFDDIDDYVGEDEPTGYFYGLKEFYFPGLDPESTQEEDGERLVEKFKVLESMNKPKLSKSAMCTR